MAKLTISLMSYQSKTVLRFGIVGLAVAALTGMYAAMIDYTSSNHGVGLVFGLISLILCPPQLLFAACIDCEVTGWGGLVMYSIIGVLNAGLYSLVGFIFVTLRKRPDPTGSNIKPEVQCRLCRFPR